MATNNAVNVSLSGQSGTGTFVGSTGPTLITPTLGAATATTLNKITFTQPATGSTFTLADGKTLTVNNTLTFTGVDTSSVNFGTGGTVSYATTGGVVWNNVTGVSQAAVINNAYVMSDAVQSTLTLPTTFPIGAVVGIACAGAGGAIMAAGAGTTIKLGNQTTSSGGSLTSSAQYDSWWVVAIVANTTWMVLGGAQSSGLTYA